MPTLASAIRSNSIGLPISPPDAPDFDPALCDEQQVDDALCHLFRDHCDATTAFAGFLAAYYGKDADALAKFTERLREAIEERAPAYNDELMHA